MIAVECPVCDEQDTASELRFDVYADSEGDPGVINGVHHFMVADLVEQDCACVLTEKQLDTLREKAAAEAADPFRYWDD